MSEFHVGNTKATRDISVKVLFLLPCDTVLWHRRQILVLFKFSRVNMLNFGLQEFSKYSAAAVHSNFLNFVFHLFLDFQYHQQECRRFIKMLLSTVCGWFLMMEQVAKDWEKASLSCVLLQQVNTDSFFRSGYWCCHATLLSRDKASHVN